jgi:hypothetical protein
VLLLAAAGWLILQTAILRNQAANSDLRSAVGRDWKGKVSAALYVVGIGAAFWQPWFAISLYVLVAGIWLIPDRRFEVRIHDHAE